MPQTSGQFWNWLERCNRTRVPNVADACGKLAGVRAYVDHEVHIELAKQQPNLLPIARFLNRGQQRRTGRSRSPAQENLIAPADSRELQANGARNPVPNRQK